MVPVCGQEVVAEPGDLAELPGTDPEERDAVEGLAAELASGAVRLVEDRRRLLDAGQLLEAAERRLDVPPSLAFGAGRTRGRGPE